MPLKPLRRVTADTEGGVGEEEELSIANAKRFAEISKRNEMDVQMGFPPLLSGTRMGWMLNMQPVLISDIPIPWITYCIDVCDGRRVAQWTLRNRLLLYG